MHKRTHMHARTSAQTRARATTRSVANHSDSVVICPLTPNRSNHRHCMPCHTVGRFAERVIRACRSDLARASPVVQSTMPMHTRSSETYTRICGRERAKRQLLLQRKSAASAEKISCFCRENQLLLQRKSAAFARAAAWVEGQGRCLFDSCVGTGRGKDGRKGNLTNEGVRERDREE
eukprot:5659950-Pleurochrysis_carterae.AAC.1